MLRILLTISILFFSLICNGQNHGRQANNWYFGDSLALNFNGLIPNKMKNSSMIAEDNPSTISDKDGNLLFYSNTFAIWDSTHQIMQNGLLNSAAHFQGDFVSRLWFSHASLILPNPCNDEQYYYFYIQSYKDFIPQANYPALDSFRFVYSVVDMTLNNGLGGVVPGQKNVVLDSNNFPVLGATRHANNRDYWLVTCAPDTNIYKSWLLTPTGISNGPVTTTSIGMPFIKNYGGRYGHIKFSHSGNRLATANPQQIYNTWPNQNNNRFELMDFDRATGTLSNHITLNFDSTFYCFPPWSPLNEASVYAVEFSPNDQILYGLSYPSLVQYDLSSNNPAVIPSSYNIVSNFCSVNMNLSRQHFYLQMGPDKKIYVNNNVVSSSSAVNNRYAIGVIHNPNVFGNGCNYVYDEIDYLAIPAPYQSTSHDSATTRGLPNILSDFLIDRSVVRLDSCHLSASLSLQDTFFVDSTSWNFGDTTGVWHTSSQLPVSHVYPGPGQYPVSVAVFSGCNVDTIVDTVDIYRSPFVDLGPDTILCEGDSMAYNLNDTAYQYSWNTGDTTADLRILQADTYSLTVSSSFCGSESDTVVVDSLIPALVHLPADTLLCSGDSLSLDASVAMGSYQWNTGDTTESITVYNNGVYAVTSSNFCGTDQDTIQVDYTIPPNIDLGPDSVLCQGDSLFLNATDTLSSYLWSTGDTFAWDTILQSGTYWAEATNLCGSDRDTVEATFLSPHITSLGGDTVVCFGDSITLRDTSQFASYLWSDNSQSDSLVVHQPGTYALTVTNACGSSSDTIEVFYDTIPDISLRDDTVFCQGNSVMLDASFSRSNYQWSNGASTPQITVQQEGTYSVTTSNLCGSDQDSFYLDVDSALTVDLGSDTILCLNDTLVVSGPSQAQGYIWSNGQNSQSIQITTQDTYWLSAQNTCGSFSDTIVALYDRSPVTNLGPDSVYCIDDLQLLDASWSRASYLWQDGSTNPTNLADSTGRYWVDVTNLCGFDDDTVRIRYHTPIQFTLGNDTVICEGDSILLNAPANNATFNWNTGNQDSLQWGFPGNKYRVTAHNLCGTKSDSIFIGQILPPQVTFPQPDTMCEGTVYTASVELQNNAVVNWEDGKSGIERVFERGDTLEVTASNQCGSEKAVFRLHQEPSPQPGLPADTVICEDEEVEISITGYQNHTFDWNTGQESPTITAKESGLYRVTVTSPRGCEGSDEIEIADCPINIFIPNAFTPNGDGLNDKFEVQGIGITDYHILIFDRWGNLVFESNDINRSWNGLQNNSGEKVNQGTYSYKLQYRSGDYELKERFGKIEVIY
ncbi:T9SS type B sorting domain-containing protein [Salibacter halophilus]|uniref:T9SS type B sorting domain-containing protein n=1 Tax=Salibacter halophilus TaxID=1803916 RepID=A0A6N6M968_9FLAO|nr:gliding motility-associated C-terminal domain-containing protein [Salibacter halophilus]KAB1064752.1 T9SS type B sorting domain-containing protein [Salibacter halophilus]